MINIRPPYIEVDRFQISWHTPTYVPSSYKLSYSCKLIHSESEYTKRKENLPFSFTSIVVGDLQPGSECVVTLVAVYNPAAIDTGITVTITTLEARKSEWFSSNKCMCITRNSFVKLRLASIKTKRLYSGMCEDTCLLWRPLESVLIICVKIMSGITFARDWPDFILIK